MKITPGFRLVLVGALAALTLTCVVLFLGMVQPVGADPTDGSYYVASSGADTSGCGQVVSPCLTINYAISEATVGATVVISPGTFTESVLLNKAITLTGAVIGQAVISTTSAGIIVTSSGAIISGTTIVGSGNGAGITVTAGIANVSVLNNGIYAYGSGIQLNGGSGHLLRSNVITGNSIGIVAGGDLSFVAYGNTISDNLTTGILFTGSGPLTATLSGAQSNVNTFFNNGINITMTAPYSQPSVNAYWNNWGVSPFSNVGATIYHHANNPGLKQVDYFTLTATVAPTVALADGLSAVTATVSITGFASAGAGSVISLTGSGPATIPLTITTGSSGNATLPITSSIAGVETITATINGEATVMTATFQALPVVRFESGNLSVGETAGPAVVTVTLNNSSAFTASVTYATSDGTAIAGSDYTAASGVLTFAPGLTRTTFTVAILDDVIDEPDETLNLTLSNSINAVLGTPYTATLTILDNDMPVVRFSSATYSVNEGASSATITATLDITSWQTVSVTYTTSNGTAIAGRDYTTASGVLTFTPGLTSTTFTVAITNDDIYESDETVNLTLSSPISATLGTPYTATLTILNDDPLPTVQFSGAPYSVNENTGPAVVSVTLSRPSAFGVTVNITTSDGTASSLSDYAAVNAILTFAPNVTSVTTTVPITNDNLYESSETVNLTLDNAISATLGTPYTTTLTIVDNDTPTRIGVQVNPSTLVAKSGATSVITATAFDAYDNPIAGVTLSGSTSSPPTLGNVTGLGLTNASGQVTGTWKAGNYIESGTLYVTNGSITGTAAITLTAGPPYSLSLVPVTASTVVTTSYVGLTAEVKDQFNNPVTNGTIVTFTTNLGNVWYSQWPTGGGYAFSGVRSTQAGIATITATSGSAQPATTTVTFTPDVPYSVTLQAGPITPTVGHTSVLTAAVYDQYHNLVSNGNIVTFTSDLGNPLSPVTTTGGVAISQISTTLASTVHITATGDSTLPGTVAVTFLPDLPYTLTLRANPITQVVGVNSTLNVTATDQFGNRVANGTSVTFTADLTSSIVSPVTTTSGIATSLISSTVAGTAHITAASGLARDMAVVTFTPDVPSAVALQARPISLTAGNSSILTATVRDRFSNLVTNGTSVTFTRDLTSSIVSPVTTMNGIATSRITSTVAGTAHITATSGSAWNTTVVTFTPGAPMTVTVSVNPQNLKAGSSVAATITATVVDRYNNPVPGVALTGTVPITLGTISGLGTTNPNGQAFGAWRAGTTAGSGLLSVGNGTVTGTTDIAVLANDPSTVFVQVISPTLFANSGMTTTVTATVRDVHDNLIPGVIVNFSLSSPTLGSVTTSGSTNAYGQAFSEYTASVPSYPGSGLLIASASYDSSYVSGTAPITLTMDVPYTLALQAIPITQVVGVNSTLNATVTDRFGNDVADDTSVTFTTDLGNVSSPHPTTSGIATSLISSTLVGTAHITATSGTAQDTAAVSFVPDVPFSMTLQARPILQTVGLSSVLTATVYDRFSNLVADNTTVAFTKDLPGDILSPSVTTVGVATSRVTITLASVAHITATSGAAWETTAVTFMPGAPVTTTVQLGTDTLIVNSNTTTTITATVVDLYNNRVPGVPVTGSLLPATLGTLNWQGPTDANGQAVGIWTAGTVIGQGTLAVGNASVTVTLAPWRVFAPVVMKDFPPKPVGKLLRINGDAGYTYQVTVTLQVSATVQQDYVEWMRFSNDNVIWGGWAAFAPTTTWKLASNNGLATVYAQFKGHWGGTSVVISDDILLFKNGDFSQGLADWTLDPNSKLNVSAAVDTTTGSPSGLLGSPAYVSCDPGANVPVGFGSLSQSFTMPPTTGMRLVLDLSYHIYTFDRNMQLTDDWDRFDVLFNGNVVKKDMNQDKDQKPPRCDTPYNLGSTTVSIPVTGSPGANIVVTFRLYNRPDRFYNTYVYVDNVHLRFE